MPPLSKKAFAKPTKKVAKTFKQPLLTQKNIEKIIGDQIENPKKQHSSNASFTTSSTENLGRKLKKRSVSMHLSFEEITHTGETSDELSFRMNEPAVKDAYLKFVKSFGEASKDNTICSTPMIKEDSTLSKSLDDLFKSVERSDPEFEESADVNSQEVKISLDSGLSLSQEVLNRKDVKNAYLECMEQFMGQEQFDFMKNFKPTQKKTKSMKSVDSSTKEKIKQPKENGKAPPKNKGKPDSNCKKPNKEDKKVNKKRKLIKDTTVETKHVESKNKKKSKKEAPFLEIKNNEGESMSLYEKMLSIQESRNVGLYALCDICDKARYLPNIKDPLDLPDKWYCSMNPDDKHNKCSTPEEIDENEIEFLIDNLYNAGSIVWAKMDGYPWWPAMVEDDPDVEEYFWLEKDIPQPTWYHVTFFDSYEVTRAWLRPSCLKPFKINMTNPEFLTSKFDKFKKRVDASFKQAVDAIGLPLIDRLRKYSFIQRYPKPLKRVKVAEKKQIPSNRKKPRKNDDLIKTKPRKVRRILSSNESLGKCDDNISDILDTIDWQNGANLKINLLE